MIMSQESSRANEQRKTTTDAMLAHKKLPLKAINGNNKQQAAEEKRIGELPTRKRQEAEDEEEVDKQLLKTNDDNDNAIPTGSTQAKLAANLRSAANEGKVELVRLLLRCGANVNAQDEQVSYRLGLANPLTSFPLNFCRSGLFRRDHRRLRLRRLS